MTTKEMKALYEATPRYWIVVMRYEYSWQIVSDDIFPPIFNGAVGAHTEYKLIHIKHKHILEAYLADNNVEIEYLYVNEVIKLAEWRTFKKDFIESYSPELEYRLKHTWNCDYCGVKQNSDIACSSRQGGSYCSTTCADHSDLDYRLKGCNHSELNSCAKCDPKFMETLMTDKEYEHLESASELKEKEDGSRPTINDSSDSNSDNRNENMVDTQLNNFQDYGFTANFEGEILKKVDGYYIGYIVDNDVVPVKIDKEGKVIDSDGTTYGLWLTPIKKKWYENPENFPALVSRYNCSEMMMCPSKEYFLKDLQPDDFELANKEEVMSLYFEDKE